jgi:hypothetical protein
LLAGALVDGALLEIAVSAAAGKAAAPMLTNRTQNDPPDSLHSAVLLIQPLILTASNAAAIHLSAHSQKECGSVTDNLGICCRSYR